MTINLQSYAEGTVSVTQGSKRVTLAGAGAAWPASWCVPGCQIVITGEAQTNYIAAWVDDHNVDLALPVARATAAGLGYSILISAPAFGTNFEAALTNIERIRLMSENVEIGDLLAVADNDAIWPAHDDLLAIWDKGDGFKIKPTTVNLLYRLLGSVAAKAADYVVEAKDIGQLIAMSAGGAARTVTLPAAAAVGVGFTVGVKKTDASASAVTVAAAAGETIDGAASLALTVQYGTVILRCDGAAWHVVVLQNTSAFVRALLDDADAAAVRATLGVAPKQASPTDTTAGAGLIVGAFGVGAQVIGTETNLDLYQNGGNFITPSAGVVGLPTGWSQGRYVLDVSGGTSYTVQVITNPATGDRMYRTYSSSWTSWHPAPSLVYQKSNILGTVSQSAGVPTGALIERGSNANGEYARFADGTQICFLNETRQCDVPTAYGSVYQGTTAWTFPATFIAPPAVSSTIRWGTGAGWTGAAGSPSTTTAALRILDINARPLADTLVMAIAIGRWF